jgi:hypothetical protein
MWPSRTSLNKSTVCGSNRKLGVHSNCRAASPSFRVALVVLNHVCSLVGFLWCWWCCLLPNSQVRWRCSMLTACDVSRQRKCICCVPNTHLCTHNIPFFLSPHANSHARRAKIVDTSFAFLNPKPHIDFASGSFQGCELTHGTPFVSVRSLIPQLLPEPGSGSACPVACRSACTRLQRFVHRVLPAQVQH